MSIFVISVNYKHKFNNFQSNYTIITQYIEQLSAFYSSSSTQFFIIYILYPLIYTFLLNSLFLSTILILSSELGVNNTKLFLILSYFSPYIRISSLINLIFTYYYNLVNYKLYIKFILVKFYIYNIIIRFSFIIELSLISQKLRIHLLVIYYIIYNST